MADQVCVDASLVLKLFLPEADSDKTQQLVESWEEEGIELIAPTLLTYEVTSAFHKNVYERNITEEQGQTILALFKAKRLILYSPDALHELAWDIAGRCGQVVLYDAYYLALAEALDCEYWTADERFFKAASTHSTQVRLLRNFTA